MNDYVGTFEVYLKDIDDQLSQSNLNEEDIISGIESIVSEWITNNPEQFFQKMYILDIDEQKLTQATTSVDPIKDIALLIYHRQLQKYNSRKIFRQDKPDDDLSW